MGRDFKPGDVVALRFSWAYRNVDPQPHLNFIRDAFGEGSVSGVQLRDERTYVRGPGPSVERRVTLFVTLTDLGVGQLDSLAKGHNAEVVL